MFAAILFLQVIIFKLAICNGQLEPKIIDGSLANEYTINYTFFTRYLDGTVLYLVDYDRNNFIITVHRESPGRSNLSIIYNKERTNSRLSHFCGCDLCDVQMTSLFIRAVKDEIKVSCNTGEFIKVGKNNTKNRINNGIPRSIRIIMDKVSQNNIYVYLSNKQVGCLGSFSFNDRKLSFQQNGTQFLSSCPRNCSPGECNDGRCRPQYPLGPLCDCSKTALQGLYCNNSLTVYKPGALHSYIKRSTNNALQIRLTWKQKVASRKYCLLSFVHEYGHVTLSSHHTFLLKGEEIMTNIIADGINFLVVNITDSNVMIMVNNKLTEARPGLFGNMTIRVGFTEKMDKCNVFEGTYDFVYNQSQLSTKNNGCQSCASSTQQRVYIKNEIALIAIGVVFVVVCTLLVAFCYPLQRKRGKKQNVIVIPDGESVITEDTQHGFYDKVKDDNSYDEISMEVSNKNYRS